MEYPNSINAKLAQITEEFNASMAALVQELKQQLRQTLTEQTENPLQNQAQPKPSQKLDDVNQNFKEEESHKEQLQIGQEDDLVLREVPHRQELLAKNEDQSSLVNQVCLHPVHGKVTSVHYTDCSSPTLFTNTAIGKFGTNETEFHVADKVFDKSPKRNAYTIYLNPKPPDVYDSCDDLIKYGFNTPAQLKTKDSITALPEVLVDPLLPLKSTGKNAHSIEQQQSVAKQMHVVVVLYNYFNRTRHSQLEFLCFESFCNLVVNLRPSMSAHTKFMHQSDYMIFDDLENQLSSTEMTIMDACKLCLAPKVAVLLIDSSKKNCTLVFSSVTHRVWSVLEKGLDIHHINSGSTLMGNKTNRINKKDLGDLVTRCYFAKHKLVWDVLGGGLKSKIEIQWENNPQPRKHTLWEVEISLNSPYFEPRIFVFNESDEANNEYDMNSVGGPAIFDLRNAASPSVAQFYSTKNEQHNFVGRHLNHFQALLIEYARQTGWQHWIEFNGAPSIVKNDTYIQLVFAYFPP